MPRSRRVRQELIPQVKAAVQRSGFTNQKLLAEDLDMARSTVNNFLTGKSVDIAVFEEICRKLSLDPSQIVEREQPEPELPVALPPTEIDLKRDAQHDWGDAPDVSVFHDRVSELSTLESWIRQDRCRLIAILGMGGMGSMGKTALSMKLAEQMQAEFEGVIWRSLRNAPPVLDLLAELIQFLSGQQEINLPDTIDGFILRLIHYLRSQRCLVILGVAESRYEPSRKGHVPEFQVV